MLNSRKKDLLFIFAFLPLLFLFYPELFLAKSAALVADHWEQHYPWTVFLFESIKHGDWPWWTYLIQGGFPITAEGQIGFFYPLNVLLCLVLPLKWAYAYMYPVHFLIAGAATYFYARQIKLQPLPAFFAACVYLFGAGYGGAYYNITSLKTLAWFPLILLFFEKQLHVLNRRNVFFTGLFIALSLLAGYQQMAILELGIVCFYVFIRILFFSDQNHAFKVKSAHLFAFMGAVFLGLLISAPQIYLMFQAALFSNRLNPAPEYAYVGSMSPVVLLTTLLPQFQFIFRGHSLYSGTLTVFLIFYAFSTASLRKQPVFRVWAVLAVFAFSLALGEWSPIYRAFITLSHFYSFRTPAKFLIFICYSMAIIAGMGMQAFLAAENEPVKNRSFKYFLYFAGLTGLVYAGILFFAVYGLDWANALGDWYVKNFIYGKAGHSNSFEVYQQKLQAVFLDVRSLFSIKNAWNRWFWFVLCGNTGLIAFLQYRRGFKKISVMVLLLFFSVDVYSYSFRDIRYDFTTYASREIKNGVVQTLLAEKTAGRLGRLYGYRLRDEKLPLQPNTNMIYGIEDVGAYSPLAVKRYYDTLGQLGNVDDSNTSSSPSLSFVLERLPWLDFLGVTHVLSTQPVDSAGFTKIGEEQAKAYLYRRNIATTRAHFVTRSRVLSGWKEIQEAMMQPGFNPDQEVLFESQSHDKVPRLTLREGPAAGELRMVKRSNTYEKWIAEVDSPGFFILANTFYPGWTVKINGRPAALLRADGLFQAVFLGEKGSYEIEFSFNPFSRIRRD